MSLHFRVILRESLLLNKIQPLEGSLSSSYESNSVSENKTVDCLGQAEELRPLLSKFIYIQMKYLSVNWRDRIRAKYANGSEK